MTDTVMFEEFVQLLQAFGRATQSEGGLELIRRKLGLKK